MDLADANDSALYKCKQDSKQVHKRSKKVVFFDRFNVLLLEHLHKCLKKGLEHKQQKRLIKNRGYQCDRTTGLGVDVAMPN